MGHKCFISFKTEDSAYKKHIQENLDIDMIDKSLNEAIDSDNEDYIMRKIREDYLSDSTVTIHLISNRSAESLGSYEQRFIKRELQASLYHGAGNTQNGILGVVLPRMYDSIFTGSGICNNCGNSHTYVNVNDTTTIKEFSYNYYIPHNRCAWQEDDRFCVLVKWDDFVKEPEKYINQAFDKRTHPIAKKTKVRP
ncbi:MAG: TIR domain-containing protein [Bacteroidia bacterium]|nr:TIR domain-containing protein [Bacteroidia bacterium]